MNNDEKIRNKTIRLFISSTFEDFKEERDIINRKILPSIENYCKSKGYRFQAVDLRYGVPRAASENNSTMKICLEEVRRCQDTGYYLNFLMLLGDRYGWTPLPSIIETNDYVKIKAWLSSKSGELAKRLDLLYYNDKNCVPEAYVLGKVNYDDKEVKVLSKAFLRGYVNKELEKCIDEKKANEYFMSATGQEILHGMLNVNNDKKMLEHIITVFSEKEADKKSNSDEAEALDMLKKQVKEHYQEAFPDNVANDLIISFDSAEDNYKADFEKRVYESIMKVVVASMKQDESIREGEVEQRLHRSFMEEKIVYTSKKKSESVEEDNKIKEGCIGRKKDVETIRNFVEESRKSLFVVEGERGSGKTVLMAHAVKSIESEKTSVIYRFIGATADSCNAFLFVQGLQKQICDMMRIEYFEKDNYNEVCDQLSFLFRILSEKEQEKLVIFIDGVDQIMAEEKEDVLKWIPEETNEKVKIIVSCMVGGDSSLLKRLEKKCGEKNILIPRPLKEDDVKLALELLLFSEQRCVDDVQMNFMADCYRLVKKPICIRLMANMAKKWTMSFTPSWDAFGVKEAEKKTPDQIIRDMYEKQLSLLEEQYGEHMVKHILGFINVSKNGLTEEELLHVTARNKAVYGEYDIKYYVNDDKDDGKYEEEKEEAKHFLKENGSLPFMVWSRIYYEMRKSLKKVTIGNDTVYDFYHLSFKDAVDEHCRDIEKECREELADYFEGEEEFYSSSGEDGMNLEPNLRKLNELPYQYRSLIKMDQKEDLIREYRELVTNHGYIFACCRAKLLKKLVNEFHDVYYLTGRMMPEAKEYERLTAKIAENAFFGVTCYYLNYGDPFGYTEKLHNMMVFRGNNRFHSLFFENGRDLSRIRSIIVRGNSRYKDFAAKLVNVQSEMRLLNGNRRKGNMEEANRNLLFIEGVEGFSQLKECVNRADLNEEGKEAIKREESRLYYDLAYMNYLTGDVKDAKKYMRESIDRADEKSNPVGKAISECVDAQIDLYTCIGKVTEDEFINKLKRLISVVFDKKKIFEDKKHENLNAARWVGNACSYLSQALFWGVNNIDIANSFREKGLCTENLIKTYKKEIYGGDTGDKWFKEIIEKDSQACWLQWYHDLLNGDMCGTLDKISERILREKNPGSIEFFKLYILVFFEGLSRLSKDEKENYVKRNIDIINKIMLINEGIGNTMGNMYFGEEIEKQYNDILEVIM